MYMNYKIDVLDELKNRGYNTTVLRKRKILAEGVIQSLRHQKPISWANLEKICFLLNCQPGDILCSGDNWDGSQLLSKPIVIVLPKKKRKALHEIAEKRGQSVEALVSTLIETELKNNA